MTALTQQMEQFSNAYVSAIAAAAGFTMSKPNVDVDSVDWCVAAIAGAGTIRSPKVEMQLKCTADQATIKEDHISFPLKAKNYNDLRHTNYQVPRILVVVLVPKDVSDWLNHSEDFLAMYRCGYWVSLRGKPETQNVATVHVDVPRNQTFSVYSLTTLMQRIETGGLP